MTYIVPNYFIENNYSNLIKVDNLFCLNYITKHKNDSVFVRTTMHSMGILLEGSKVIHLNDQDITINQGEISFLTQNNYYMSERTTLNSLYKSLIIYFNDQFILNFIKKYNIIIDTDKTQSITKVTYHNDTLFKNNISIFQQYLEKKYDDSFLTLKTEEIFLQALRLNNHQMHSFINSILFTSKDRIKFILESNIDLIQTFDDMCKITRLTPNKIRNYFKKEYSTTPKVWLDTKRLEKAVILLQNTNKTITDISSECGYSTVSWFISQFKKQYNQTPKEFRYKI